MLIVRSGIAVMSAVHLLIAAMLLLMISTASSTAGWRDELKSITIGIIGGPRPALARRYIEPFRKALEDDLQITVRVVASTDYASMISAQINGRIDYGIYSASAYATLWAKCKCVEPIAAARIASGADKFHSILVVNQGETSSLDGLGGKRIAFSTDRSLTGYILPIRELPKQGLVLSLQPAGENDIRLVAAGSAEKAVEMFLNGDVDGVFGWSTMSGQVSRGYSAGTLVDLIQKSGRGIADFSILWKSGPIPGSPHVISKKLPEPAKKKIAQFLLRLNDTNPAAYDAVENYNSGGFTEVSHASYQYLIDLVTENNSPTKKAGRSDSNDG